MGVGICIVGYGPLSFRKHPRQGCGYAILGFFVRLTGLALIAFGLVQFAIALVEARAVTASRGPEWTLIEMSSRTFLHSPSSSASIRGAFEQPP